eukprot:CCRYP_002712-RB/>CCRYP_002712-RB protein AED:0.33 eAED:0.33 QI:0/0/0/1/0/0/2/0/411
MQTITQETMLHFSQLLAPTFTAQRAVSWLFPTDFLNAILNEDTGELMEYRNLIKDPKYSTIWRKAYGKELGRLAQGIPGIVQGTNTIVFITKDDVPTDRCRDVTYVHHTLQPSTTSDSGRIHLCPCTKRYVWTSTGRHHCTTIPQNAFSSKRISSKHRHPRIWKHDWRPVAFALCVDDFGVKNVGIEHAKHLLHALNTHYTTLHDWKGDQYLGLVITWDYPCQQVNLSMPGYCHKAGQRFRHNIPMKPQHQPYPHTPRTYGAKQQYVDDPDLSAPLNKQDTTFIQEVIGVFLYYARAVDCTMLTALSSLATQQAKPTQNTLQHIHRFLNYAMTHQDAVVTYQASNMTLATHSDASYLSETKARSRAGGHFFLTENDEVPRNNGAILTLAQIIKSVMSSAAEAELGALYINA